MGYIRIYKHNNDGVFKGSWADHNNFTKPMPGASIYNCFAFFDSSFLKEQLFVPKLLSYDDNTLPIKIFTDGGHLYYYEKNIINHLWVEDRQNYIERSNTHKTDPFSNNLYAFLVKSKKFKDNLLAVESQNFNLNKKRTLRDYERFSGVNFIKKTLREKSVKGIFEEWQEVGNFKKIKKIFININN